MTETQIIIGLMVVMALLFGAYLVFQVVKTIIGSLPTKAAQLPAPLPQFAPTAATGRPAWLPIASIPQAVADAKPATPKDAPSKLDPIAAYTTECERLRRVETYLQSIHGDDDEITKAFDTLLLKMHQKPVVSASK